MTELTVRDALAVLSRAALMSMASSPSLVPAAVRVLEDYFTVNHDLDLDQLDQH